MEGDYKNCKERKYQEVLNAKDITTIKKYLKILKSENITLNSEIKTTKELIAINKEDIDFLETKLSEIKREGKNENSKIHQEKQST